MDRKGFIGGSDTVTILGGDWLHLWEVKTGRAEPDDLSSVLRVQLGIWTEPFNLDWFARHSGRVVSSEQYSTTTEVGGVPLKATIDGFVSEDNAIIECKHTHAGNTMERCIQYYMPQLQTYCHATKANGAYLSVIFGNDRWEASFVEYNHDYFSSMWSVVSDFWGYVVRDQRPVAIDQPTIPSIDAIPVDQMVKRDASQSNEFMDAAHTFASNQQAAATFEAAKKSLKQMVADNEREVYCDLLSVRRAKNGALRIHLNKE